MTDEFDRITTLSALVLDVLTWRKTTSRGKYAQMRDDKAAGIAPPSNQPYDAPHYADCPIN